MGEKSLNTPTRPVVSLRMKAKIPGTSDAVVNSQVQVRITELLKNCSDNLDGSLLEAFRYHFATPGKMLRAQLAYNFARLHSASEVDADRWGLAVELIHNASLIHDDICDSDLFRRGRPSAMAKFGQQTALCLGDALISQAFGILARESIPRTLIAKLAMMVRACASGQAQEFCSSGYPNWQQYCDIAGGKTSSLLTGAVEGGALFDPLVDNNPKLSNYCFQMSLVFQMLNDAENIESAINLQKLSTDFCQFRPNALIVLYRDSLSAEDQRDFDNSIKIDINTSNKTGRSKAELWWAKMLRSDIVATGHEKVMLLLSQIELNFRDLSPALQRGIAPLLAHAKNCMANQNRSLLVQRLPIAKEYNG
tara:strand:- start:122 stop:1216 length:1095 start_codon:yes stop_codon:yes gene_type:complete